MKIDTSLPENIKSESLNDRDDMNHRCWNRP